MMTCLPACAAAMTRAGVEVVGDADVDDVAVGVGDRPIEIGEPARNLVPLGEGLRAGFAPRAHRHDLGVRDEACV